MRYQRINRQDPEKVFVACKNAYSTTHLSAGNVVVWAYNGTDDGLAVTRPASTKLALIAGVVTGTIAISGYGEIQVYGHNADVTVKGFSTATSIFVGAKLLAVNALFSVTKDTGTLVNGESGVIILGQEVADDTALHTGQKVFIRCM